MMIQNRELEELQAKIREAEERLKARKSMIMTGNSQSVGAHKDGGYQSTGKHYTTIRSVAIGSLTRSSNRISISDDIANGHGGPVLERRRTTAAAGRPAAGTQFLIVVACQGWQIVQLPAIKQGSNGFDYDCSSS